MLRPYQQNAIDELRDGFKRGNMRQILMLPTGAGKTVVASHMAQGAVERGRDVLFICERITLVEQAAQRFHSDGLDVSIMQGDHPDYRHGAAVQVASAQTLARRHWPDAGLIIIDEAHILHSIHKKIMTEWNNVPVIGLTATPWARGMGRYFSNVVAPVTVSDLVGQGHLVGPIVYGPAKPDMKGVRTIAGDYETKGSSDKAMKIIGDVVEHWKKHAQDRPTIVFAVDIAHSKALQALFLQDGITAEHIDAYTDSADRRETFRRFREGETKILLSVDVTSRGWDEPIAACACLCRPTKSLMVHFQQIGRVLRSHETKSNALILDFAGNHERLGFVTDPVPTTLDMGEKKTRQALKKGETEPKAITCPVCKTVTAPAKQCPTCGEQFRKPTNVTHLDGHLERLKSSMTEKIVWYSGLKWYCNKQGYASGWAANKYREKFGVWPNDTRLKSAPLLEPTQEVMGWIRHKQIKYAKRRA